MPPSTLIPIPVILESRHLVRLPVDSLRHLAKAFAVTEGFLHQTVTWNAFFELMNLEKGLVVAALAILAGGGLLLTAVRQWWLTGFGHLDYAYTMRFVVPEQRWSPWGFQTVFSSFFRQAFLGCDENESDRFCPPWSTKSGSSRKLSLSTNYRAVARLVLWMVRFFAQLAQWKGLAAASYFKK